MYIIDIFYAKIDYEKINRINKIIYFYEFSQI